MAVDTQHPDVNAGRETSESLKIYSLDDYRNPKNIYLNNEGLKGKQRRYFTPVGAFAYSELFVKTAKGDWVGEVSGATGYGQRLIRTKHGNWVKNQYQILRPETKVYPRQFLSDTGTERIDAMNKGTWGQSITADVYWAVMPHEAESWLTKAGYDLNSSEFTGIDFQTKSVPHIFSLTETKPKGNKPALEV